MVRPRRTRYRPRRRSSQMNPRIYTLESEALTAADTPLNTIIYSTSASATTLFKPSRFVYHTCRVSVKAGSANAVIYAILRKVPQGYSTPAVTITDGNTTFVDTPNILAYGAKYIYAATNDTMSFVDLRSLQGSLQVRAGEAVVLQIVTDTSSAGQSIDCILEYEIQ